MSQVKKNYICGFHAADCILDSNPYWVDKTGNYNAILNNSNGLSKNNDSLVFNGTRGIEIAYPQNLNNNSSIELVFKTPSSFGKYIALIGNANSNGGFCLVRRQDGNNNRFALLYNYDNVDNIYLDLEIDTLYHFIMTYTNNNINIYLNGELVGSNNGTIRMRNNNIVLGEGDIRNTNYERYWNGEFKYLHFFDYVLNPQEVQNNADYYLNGELEPQPPAPVKTSTTTKNEDNLRVRKFHRLNEGFGFVGISNVVVNQKKDDYDVIEFTSNEKLSNGEIVIVGDEPFVIRNTKYIKNQSNEYSGEEFASRAKDSIPCGIVALNEPISDKVDYLLGNTFGAYFFDDAETLTCTIEGEIWNCDDLFKYLNEEKGYTISFDYDITDDYIYTTVSIIKEDKLDKTEVVLKQSDFTYEIELDSSQVATAIYPNLDEAGAGDAWCELNVSPGTSMQYYDEQGKETGDFIEAKFNKDSDSWFMYILDYDQNDFGDYGINNFMNADEQNILKFKNIDVSETNSANIFLKMQEEFIKLVESSIKVNLEINENIDELYVGTVCVAHLGESYNLLSKGEDVKVISTEIIEKKIEFIDENEQKISYTTSDEGIKLKALIKGRLQSLKNIITVRG